MELLLALMITSSLMFLMLNHPMSMGFNLLIQAVIISMMTGMMNLNFWYSYILFLVMIGGMLVLFIYMTSIASNEKFYYTMKMTMMMILSLIVTMYFFHQNNYMDINDITNNMNYMKNISWTMSLNKYFMFPMNILTMGMMMYLFIALMAVVKITKSEYGTMKSN
uniref:NADH-ubiquinone oxidoreductase chain 6 n=1 Tax=Trachys troglodytiformis TaxID=1244535 RepID=A0A343C3Y2_9COLE|nr:NADH dehydrogenase subunit 6 [Trachys troglodytiformis]